MFDSNFNQIRGVLTHLHVYACLPHW